MDEAGLQSKAARSKVLIQEQFPDITWEHSHVVTSPDGEIRSFCIYEAPTAELVHEHAGALGAHHIAAIHEVAGDVSPADFPD
jgi:ligand-binding SRPBCC domain-containing protein